MKHQRLSGDAISLIKAANQIPNRYLRVNICLTDIFQSTTFDKADSLKTLKHV